MTPFEDAGYTKDTIFLVVVTEEDDCPLRLGTEVRLSYDDGSTTPYFFPVKKMEWVNLVFPEGVPLTLHEHIMPQCVGLKRLCSDINEVGDTYWSLIEELDAVCAAIREKNKDD